MQWPMPFSVSSIDLTPYQRPAIKFMSLDCSLTVLRHTRFAGGSALLSRINSVGDHLWHARWLGEHVR